MTIAKYLNGRYGQLGLAPKHTYCPECHIPIGRYEEHVRWKGYRFHIECFHKWLLKSRKTRRNQI